MEERTEDMGVGVEAFSCAVSKPAMTSQPRWNRTSLTIDQLCEATNVKDSTLVAFVDTAIIALPTSFAERKRLSLAFHIPTQFWTNLCEDAGGFYSAYEHQSTQDQGHCYRQAFRFLTKQCITSVATDDPSHLAYRWDKLGFVTCWHSSGNLTVLCFDAPEVLKQDIRDHLVDYEAVSSGHSAFSFNPLLLMCVTRRFDMAVWSWRDVAIHLDAQHNGHVTSHIAELAQRDGEITKGISVLGMVFLPGTFVSVRHLHIPVPYT
ncbi:hypothetical protein LTR49_026227 [Elasticomyces elasticus]|nr:hypothetical protein LTR49_026227 [Elasticomyces elasticus]